MGGRFFEEWKEGEEFLTPSRTVFVKLSVGLVNQKGEVIQSGVKTFGFKRRAGGAS